MLRVTPARAFFRPGEPITLIVAAEPPLYGQLTAHVYHLAEQVAAWNAPIAGTHAELSVTVPPTSHQGYLVHVEIEAESAFTAFDVLDSWTDAPRYGFLHDFRSGRPDDDIRATLDHLLGLHVNGLQFYDWQYRHDTLLPPQDEFTDPLGRSLSLATVRALIDTAHERGMAAMPYTAIYAASPPFAAAHPDWQLYDNNRQPIDFANGFLKIMNPCSGWQAHFVEECRRMLAALPFDGIHVDQYGEPTSGFNANAQPVDLPAGFRETLARLREVIGTDKALLFNLVHNWPVDALADSPLDFWYSELWPPDTAFTRLWRTIRDNRQLNARPAVLAVYIPPAWENTVIAAHSTILAAGGTHIAHGEHGQYLSDPYFPKAGIPSPALAMRLQSLADFAVAYEETMTFAEDVTDYWIGRIQWDGQPTEPGRVIVRAAGSRMFIHLLDNAGRWDAEQPPGEPISGIRLTIPTKKLRKAWWASPGAPIPQPRIEPFIGDDLRLSNEWQLICLEFEAELP